MNSQPIPSPGTLLRRYGLAPRKSWGQNFLHAVEIHQQICRASGAEPGRRVLEIGAGLGTLTMHLLATGAEVWAIERDRDLCAVLRKELASESRFVLHEADAVKFDYKRAFRPGMGGDKGRALIVGNLPYQLTGMLLFKLLDYDAETGPWTVMVQREVADRLCAGPGSKTYGGATISLSRCRKISRVCAVSRGCFLPPPRVDSAVIRFDPRPEPLGTVADEKGFLALVRASFQRRRKTLKNSLAGIGSKEEVAAWISAAGIDPQRRPEQLAPEEFAAIQRAREQSDEAKARHDA